MTGATLTLVLVAALAHALWNVASKYKRGNALVYVWCYTAVSAGLLVLVSAVSLGWNNGSWSWALAPAALVSALFHVAYSLVLQFGYDRSELSVVYPVARGSGPLITMVVAIVVLGERPGDAATLGAVIIVGGIAVVTGNPFRNTTAHKRQALAWGLTTGVMIAGYTLWDSYSIATVHLAPTAYFSATLVLETLLLTPAVLRHRSSIALVAMMNWRTIAVVATLSPLAYILVLTALQTAPVSLVAPLRESSIVVGAFLAWWLFGEQHIVRRIAGAVVVLAGMVLVGLT